MGRRPPLQTHNPKFPSHLVNVISSYLNGRTFEASFQTATSTSRRMRAGVAQGGIISPVLFSLYVNDMPRLPATLSWLFMPTIGHHSHVSSASAPSQIPGNLSHLEGWLSEWRIAINVSKSSAMLFAKTARRIQNPEQYSSPGCQSNGSKSPVILELPLINGSTGRSISTR